VQEGPLRGDTRKVRTSLLDAQKVKTFEAKLNVKETISRKTSALFSSPSRRAGERGPSVIRNGVLPIDKGSRINFHEPFPQRTKGEAIGDEDS